MAYGKYVVIWGKEDPETFDFGVDRLYVECPKCGHFASTPSRSNRAEISSCTCCGQIVVVK